MEILLNLFVKPGFRRNSIDFMGEMCYNSVTLRSKSFSAANFYWR